MIEDAKQNCSIQPKHERLTAASRVGEQSNGTDVNNGRLLVTHVADQIDAPTSGGCYRFDDPRALVFGKTI